MLYDTFQIKIKEMKNYHDFEEQSWLFAAIASVDYFLEDRRTIIYKFLLVFRKWSVNLPSEIRNKFSITKSDTMIFIKILHKDALALFLLEFN
jgi:hypothetical protein